MSHTCDLSSYALDVEEALTHIEDSEKIIIHIDLGSADVWLTRESEKLRLTILTSSGHALSLPADLFASVL